MRYLLILLLAGCSTIDTHTAPPRDWPNLRIVEHRVPHNVMRDRCAKYTAWGSYPEACAEVNFAAMRCDIWFSADFPPLPEWVEHERLHCSGHGHEGEENTLAVAWTRYKQHAAGAAVARGLAK